MEKVRIGELVELRIGPMVKLRIGTNVELALIGRIGCMYGGPWGHMGVYRCPWGRNAATPWGRMEAHGDVWGPMGSMEAHWGVILECIKEHMYYTRVYKRVSIVY